MSEPLWPWEEEPGDEPAGSGEALCDCPDDIGPAADFDPDSWDPLWDAFEPYDPKDEPLPEYGDFWVEREDE
jgi:hypothetical protein